MIIYSATNKINGKKYIGQTITNIKWRRNAHIFQAFKKMSNFPFYKALRKYGKNSFEWEILYECNSKYELDKKEIYYIFEYNTQLNGYNVSPGGSPGGNTGMNGYHHTEKTKKHLSKVCSKALSGHKHSEETKNKISKSKRGYKRNKENIKKQSETIQKKLKENSDYYSYWKDKNLSEEYKLNIQKGSMGKRKPGTSIAMKKKWENYRKQKLQEK